MNLMDVIVKINNISFSYPGMPFILQSINLSINKGDFLAITGPNGSAKTTLLKLILGIYKPQIGNIEIFGQNNLQFKDWHKVGYVPQKTSFFNPGFPATVQEIVGLGLIPQKYTKQYKVLKIHEALELVDLADKKKRKIGELSGGELQRALIARSLINNPEILLLDEPTANLDLASQQKLSGLLEFLNQELKICIVMVTHDPHVLTKASRLIKIAQGKLTEVDISNFNHAASL